MRKAALPILGVVIVAGGLLLLYGLFATMYGTGTRFPAYSTLGADPSGAEVLYRSLARLEGASVERNYQSIEDFEGTGSTTLVIAGALPTPDPTDILDRLEAFVKDGGHLIITFEDPGSETALEYMTETESESDENEEGEADEPSRPARKPGGGRPDRDSGDEPDDMLSALTRTENIGERWGFGYGFDDTRDEMVEGEFLQVQAQDDAPEGSPNTYPWYSRMYFEPEHEDWRALYVNFGHGPVLMERPLGEGRIVLASDSYFLSNEAMLRNRAAAVLEHALLQQPRIVFDESHHGLGPQPGIMKLLRRYRLTVFIWIAILLVALYAWRSATSLAPRQYRPHAEDEPAKRGNPLDGMTALLRRSLSDRAVLRSMQQAWDGLPQSARAAADNATLEEAITETEQLGGTLAERYNAVQTRLKERNPWT